MIDPELKAELEKLASKEDLKELGAELKNIRRDVWDLAGDVARVDGKLDKLAESLRTAGVRI